MGFFGKKQDTNAPTEPGAHYVKGNDEDLPIAIPVEATVVQDAPRPSAPRQSITTTTVYPPGGKQPYVTSTQLPMSETFVTHIPAPIATGTGEIMGAHFRRMPMRLQCCPSCQQPSRTKTHTWPNIATWIACLILLLLFWPICWIPLVCDVFKQTDHYCGVCGSKVGEVTPFSDCCEKRRG